MQHQDIEFLQQFHRENIELPFEDRHYGNVYFRHYSGGRKQRAGLEELVEDHLAHPGIIETLINGIEKEDQPADRQLATFLQKAYRTTLSYSRNEPRACDRLKRLADEILELSGTVRMYEMRAQPNLLDTLKNISVERKAARDCSYAGSGHVRTMQLVVRKYRDAMDLFHNLFTRLLEQECERKGQVTVISPVGECLLRLTGLIKERIVLIENCFNRLGEWKLGLRLGERQGLYN